MKKDAEEEEMGRQDSAREMHQRRLRECSNSRFEREQERKIPIVMKKTQPHVAAIPLKEPPIKIEHVGMTPEDKDLMNR